MADRFRVILVGRSKCRWAGDAVEDYRKRCRRYGGVDEVAVKSEVFRGDVDAVRQAESARVLGAVPERARLVVLDERGEGLSTEGFVALLREGRRDGPLCFALGGAYGHDAALRAAAWRVVRLSELVLNHEVARVVLHEQIYRALSLIEGGPYHH